MRQIIIVLIIIGLFGCITLPSQTMPQLQTLQLGSNTPSAFIPATNTPSPTITLVPTSTQTNTITPSTTPTSKPTLTPFPNVNLESFVFPYNVPQLMKVWDQLNISWQNRYITYHINNRSDRSIPYENSCGYHPGDLICMLGSNTYYDNFLIDVILPYSGTLVDSWKTQGNDDGFTFFMGMNDDKKVYLNVYHTQVYRTILLVSLFNKEIFLAL